MIDKIQFQSSILPTTLGWESGYSNHPGDRGGETYRGISRVFHPNWSGWPIVDKYKAEKQITRGDIINDEALKDSVRNFYFANYFIPNKFNLFDSQIVALMCFDFAVNGGYSVALLQQVLNTAFNCGLVVDGMFGAKTLAAVNTAEPVKLAHAILDARQKHFNRIIELNPKQSVFENGWNNRIAYLRQIVKGGK